MNTSPISYKRHRFPPQIIAHAVWLYFRFPLSLRLVEEMLLERGIVVSYETIRRWAKKFGPDYARRLHRKKPSRNDVWHLDEVVITIAGRKHWLWRAVDQDGYLLDEIVQNRRNTKAAKRLLNRLLTKQGHAPKRIITDKLRSYGAARRQIMPNVEHRSHKGSTIAPRIRTYHCESGKERCSGSDRREVCNVSSLSSQPSEIFSSHLAPNDLHYKFTCIASKRAQSGRLRREPWPEINP